MGTITVTITLTNAGSNTGPFDIYSDVDIVNPLATNVDKSLLTSGTYKLTNVPSNATKIIIKSVGICTTQREIIIEGI